MGQMFPKIFAMGNTGSRTSSGLERFVPHVPQNRDIYPFSLRKREKKNNQQPVSLDRQGLQRFRLFSNDFADKPGVPQTLDVTKTINTVWIKSFLMDGCASIPDDDTAGDGLGTGSPAAAIEPGSGIQQQTGIEGRGTPRWREWGRKTRNPG
jgi:hypothetical protein